MSDTLRIYTFPEPVLRKKAKSVENIDSELQAFIDRMGETMYCAPGIGLAANQVGELKRVLVYDVDPTGNGRRLSVLINPEIIHGEGEIVHEEACLSVIDFSAEVTRFASIKVRGYDRREKPVDIEAEGLLAICLQHEIDHLDGKLFLDRIGSVKRSLYKRRLQKMLKKQKDSETGE